LSTIFQSPADATLDYTTDHVSKMVDKMEDTDKLQEIWQVVETAGGFGGLVFKDYAERDFTVQEKMPEVFMQLNGITGLRILPILFPSLPTAGQFDVEMVVQGTDDYKTMEGYAYQIIGEAYKSGMFMYVDTDLKIDLPQARLELDHERIADLGLNINSVTSQISAQISDSEVNRFNADGKAYLVIPMLKNSARKKPEDLLSLNIKTATGDFIPLSSIASIHSEVAPRKLGKFNQQKSFRIFGGAVPGVTKGDALDAVEAMAKDVLPANYIIDFAGESRQLRKEGNSMGSVLLLALAVVYLVLTVQFNSFRSSLVVLLGSVPLAITSALAFSFFSLTTVNIYAQIGIITLVGLIAKNGILITEFANELQHQGLVKLEAIKQAAQTRLRPILMTTAATVLGHFPLVLVTGAGAEARNSIGIILVAGMFIGTMFTLFVLPSVYMLFAENYAKQHKKQNEENQDSFSSNSGQAL